MNKTRMALGAMALAVLAAFGAWATPVDEATARTAAERFLQTSKMAARTLPDRSVESIGQRGNLWVVRLAPSGHILLSGSDRATPIIGFSQNDFLEGEEDSAERAMLDAADAAVAAAEADATKARHSRWDKLLADSAKSVLRPRLLAANTSSGVNIEPFITSRYNQCQPWNDFAPVVGKDADTYYRGRSLAGCVSIADAALFRVLRWPVYVARTDTVTHGFREGTFNIRFDGSAPFDWDNMDDTYPVGGDQRGKLSEEKRYQIGRYVMWLNHSASMNYQVGVSTSTKYTSAHGAERDWYTIGYSMSPSDEGVKDKVTSILEAGIPVFVGVGGHAVVADGWKVEENEDYVDLVYGWGGAGSWFSLADGPVKYFWVDHYPRAKPQLDPIPRVVGEPVTLSWHFPDCYTNNLSGFVITKKRRTSAALTDWTADFSNLAATGIAYPANIWSSHTFDKEDGKVTLNAGDLTYGMYQFSTPLTVTADSVLSLKMRGGANTSGDANKHNIVIEICGEDGNWKELLVPECTWANWPGRWTESTKSLAEYAGQTVQLRIYKRHATYNGRVNIGDFKVTNVIPLDGDDTVQIVDDSTARSATLTDIVSGADYAFSVVPILDDDQVVVAGYSVIPEASDEMIATIEGTHQVPGSTVDVTEDYTTETAGETSIEFTDSFQITEASQLSFEWTADCDADGSVTLYVYFTPTGGEKESVYNITKSYFVIPGVYYLDESGEYAEKVSLAGCAGRSGKLEIVIVDAYLNIASSSSVSSNLQVMNVMSTGTPELETLTAKGMPEFTKIQYAANGYSAEDLTNGYLADGAIGSSTMYVTCSEDVTNLTATPSHLTLVSNETVHVTHLNDGRWQITFDKSIPANRDRQRMILTLHATDSNGTTAHRDVVMRMTKDVDSDDEQAEMVIYTPKARPIAVWCGDFADGAKRGTITLNANGNTIAQDGSYIEKAGTVPAIRFRLDYGAYANSVLVAAGTTDLATDIPNAGVLPKTVIAITSTGYPTVDTGFGVQGDNTSVARFDDDNNTLLTLDETFDQSGFHTFAFGADKSSSYAILDGEILFSDAQCPLNHDANCVCIGANGNPSASMQMMGGKLNYIAIFTNETASADDAWNWNLANLKGATTIGSEGGAITAQDTGRDLALNLNGGTVTLDEMVYAAAICVQEDTTLNISSGCSISGSRVIYVAPGKKLTVNYSGDVSAITNAVDAAGGVYNLRIIQGANYGDVVLGSCPDNLGDGYKVEFSQNISKGVYVKVTDLNRLNIRNGDNEVVGYIDESTGTACVITNATGTITIPETIKMVQIVAKDDEVKLNVSADNPPTTITIFASDENGAFTPLPLYSWFSQTTSAGGDTITVALDKTKVTPEYDSESDDMLLEFVGAGSDKKAKFPVKIIPGLWYCVEHADNIKFVNLARTVPEMSTSDNSKTLIAPAVGNSKFYRIRVGASRSSLASP